MATRKPREWRINRMSVAAQKQFAGFLEAIRDLEQPAPQETKKVDHINYIQIGDCLYIQVVYEDGSTMDIKICAEKPPTGPVPA
jgi:hypothetical protein